MSVPVITEPLAVVAAAVDEREHAVTVCVAMLVLARVGRPVGMQAKACPTKAFKPASGMNARAVYARHRK